MLCIVVRKAVCFQNTLIEVPNVVDQTAAARAFPVTNVESAFIVKFLAVLDDISLLMLFFVQKLQNSVGQSEACIRVVFDKAFK